MQWFSAAPGLLVASAIEIGIAPRLAGTPLDFSAVVVIESLLYAIRIVASAIPARSGKAVVCGGA